MLKVWLPDQPTAASPGKLLEMQNWGSDPPYEKLRQGSGRAEGALAIYVFKSPTGDSDAFSSLRPTALTYSTSFTAQEDLRPWTPLHKLLQQCSWVPAYLQKVYFQYVRIQEVCRYVQVDEVFKPETQPTIN